MSKVRTASLAFLLMPLGSFVDLCLVGPLPQWLCQGSPTPVLEGVKIYLVSLPKYVKKNSRGMLNFFTTVFYHMHFIKNNT